MDLRQHLQDTLHHEIPLTNAIGIEVAAVNQTSVTLTAPLENNINHKSTAFGGSLYSVAVLSGWGLIFTRLEALDLHAHIVIQESEIQYLQPVKGEIRATCQIDSEELFQKFVHLFEKKGRARIALRVEIEGSGGPAVLFRGKYVIHK